MDILPKRKQIRVKNYDYSQNGCYFVTICTKDKKPLFWDNKMIDELCGCGHETLEKNIYTDGQRRRGGYYPPENRELHLSEFGKVVKSAIQAIPIHYTNVKIDEYIIMPDHVHLILILSNEDEGGRIISAPTRSVSTIIGQMKRWVSKKIGVPVWQKSYYEHIIRNEADYLKTVEYIKNNPLKSE